MRSFKIITNGLQGEMSLEKDSTIANNIFLSLSIKRGSWWFDPNFGSRLHLLQRMKLTDRTVKLAKEYAKEALQWLLDTGRAKTIEITAERDLKNPHQLNMWIQVYEADGNVVTYEYFVEVV